MKHKKFRSLSLSRHLSPAFVASFKELPPTTPAHTPSTETSLIASDDGGVEGAPEVFALISGGGLAGCFCLCRAFFGG